MEETKCLKPSDKDRDLDRYFPVRISIVIGMGLPPGKWGTTFSAMLDWLKETAGNGRHAVLSDHAPGRPDAMRVLFASFDDARAFVEQFAVPIAPIGGHPRR